MSNIVYTNYWVNRLVDQRKEHGSYPTEEAAIEAIKTWWEIHNESFSDIEYVRTNSGALEILYGNPNYLYRIEKHESEQPLPKQSYKLKSAGEIESLRGQLDLDQETFLFDELAEPYRDRLIIAMGDSTKVRNFLYSENGRPTIKVEEYNSIH